MDKKSLLAVVLSLVVIFAWQIFFAQKSVKKQPEPAQQQQGAATTVDPKQEVVKETAAEPAKPAASRTVLSRSATGTEIDIPVETPFYSATFTTRGGALKSFKLKNYRKTLAKDSDPIELVHVTDGMPRPLTVTFPESNIDIRPDSLFSADIKSLDLTNTEDSRQLTFTLSYPNEIKVEKTYTFHPGKFVFDLEIKVHNLASFPINQSALLAWHQFVDPKVATDSYTHEGPLSFISKSIDRYEVNKMESAKLLGPNVAWGGFENKYFIASLISQNPTLTSIALSKDARNMVTVSLKGPPNIIPPGQAGLFSYALYLGPKDHDLLKAQGVGLENAIDFGDWLKWLAMPLLVSMKFLYGFVHNYGVAIIILTLLIKIIFWPLGNKSYKSMKDMQKLQPKLAELREKYKNDKTKIGQETMALYKAHKVSPMGGCLPMVIQIPVFFGLYKTLLYAIELRHAPFMWWIQDLSAPDTLFGHIPLVLPVIGGFAIGPLPILMGATMFIQQKMSPPAGEPMQQKLMLWMPVIFTFMFLNFPSGLVLYWLFQNILSIGQQYYINKRPS
jgi:YidC/Oxa1 family membrane protein insertase